MRNKLLKKIKKMFLKDSLDLDLLSFVSHELKTPLSTLKLNIELLKAKASGPQKQLDMMDEEVEWMIQFISDTLDLGERRLNLTACSWNSWLAFEQQDMLKKAHLHNRKLKIELLKTDKKVRMDSFYIRQALWNLLINALEHSSEGSTIEISCLPKSEKELTISVQDEGQGLEPNTEKKVFEAFYKRNKPNHAIKGSGLGLVIVKKITEAHGGKVSAQNRKEGTGAIFTLTLPNL